MKYEPRDVMVLKHFRFAKHEVLFYTRKCNLINNEAAEKKVGKTRSLVKSHNILRALFSGSITIHYEDLPCFEQVQQILCVLSGQLFMSICQGTNIPGSIK